MSRSAKSYSAAPTTVGAAKSPLGGAIYWTRQLRNSSPTRGSFTTLTAKIGCAQPQITGQITFC